MDAVGILLFVLVAGGYLLWYFRCSRCGTLFALEKARKGHSSRRTRYRCKQCGAISHRSRSEDDLHAWDDD